MGIRADCGYSGNFVHSPGLPPLETELFPNHTQVFGSLIRLQQVFPPYLSQMSDHALKIPKGRLEKPSFPRLAKVINKKDDQKDDESIKTKMQQHSREEAFYLIKRKRFLFSRPCSHCPMPP